MAMLDVYTKQRKKWNQIKASKSETFSPRLLVGLAFFVVLLGHYFSFFFGYRFVLINKFSAQTGGARYHTETFMMFILILILFLHVQ